jgi:hypothetical protein
VLREQVVRHERRQRFDGGAAEAAFFPQQCADLDENKSRHLLCG